MNLKPNKGSFSKASPRPGPGRPKLTDEAKRLAMAKRAAEYDLKEECRKMLPLVTDGIIEGLEKGEFKGAARVHAMEALRDTAHGRPAQTIQGSGGGPLVITFTQLLGKVDGGKDERL